MAINRLISGALIVGLVGGFIAGAAAAPAQAGPLAPGEVQMLSVSASMPPRAGDRYSAYPSMSSDGRYVVFTSSATNLLALPLSESRRQVYLRDTVDGSTRAVSATGGSLGNSDSELAVVSGDGMFVAFISTATNLIPSATSGIAQVMVWSRASDTLILASMTSLPAPANRPAIRVAISDDGKKIVYSSKATNLVAQSTFGVAQIYSRDMVTKETTLESVDSRTPNAGAQSDASLPAISGDGRVVAFSTSASLTTLDTSGKYQVYVRVSGSTEPVSVRVTGEPASTGDSDSPALSADGRLVVFTSTASELGSLDGNGHRQIYLRDLRSHETRLVSVDSAQRSPGNYDSEAPAISRDGSTVAFDSLATNLVPEAGASSPGAESRTYVRRLGDERTLSACRLATTLELCDGPSLGPTLSENGRVVAFSSEATNLVPGTPTTASQVYLRDITELPRIDRIGGADRFEVSAATARDAFGTGVPVVYVASGAGFADALSGSAAAGAERGPMLLVTKNSIPISVGIELHRLRPQRIILLGGLASIDANVESALAAYSGSVVRISGADRFEVSAAVSGSVFFLRSGVAHPPVYIASGAVFPDALSGSAAAGAMGGPVLLVTKDSIPDPVMAELKRLTPSRITVLGGRNTIAESVVSALGAVAPTTRIDGADRFAVSAAVSLSTFSANARVVYVASGAVFPDALSGSAAAIQNRGPVLLVTADQIPAPVAAELQRLKPRRIVVLGGENTVSSAVSTALRGYLATG